MRKCKKCGAESEGKFCPECGAPLEEQPSEVKESEAVTITEPAAPFEEILGQPTSVPVRQQDQPPVKLISVLAGSRVQRSYVNIGLSKKLWLFGIIAMIVSIVLSGIGWAINYSDVSSKAYEAHYWYEGGMTYILYSVTPEHYNTVIVMLSLSSFVLAAGFAIWAVRKSIIYPEAARLLNGMEVKSMFIYYEGLSADQKKSVDAQCQVNKTYRMIRILTYIGSAIIACCAVVYFVNAIGSLAKYFNQFDSFIEAAVDNTDYKSLKANAVTSYCPGVIIASLVILLVYDLIFIFVRKNLNAKACQQLSNVKL